MEVLAALGGAVVAIGVGVGGWLRQRSIRDRWGQARRVLLDEFPLLQADGKVIRGKAQDVPLEVSARTVEGRGAIIYRAAFPSGRPAIALRRQSGRATLAKAWGAVDSVIGDGVFDEAFMIGEGSQSRARRYLTAERRELLLELFSRYEDVRLVPDSLTIHGALDAAPDSIVSHMRDLMEAAIVLGAGRGRPSPEDMDHRPRPIPFLAPSSSRQPHDEPRPYQRMMGLLEALSTEAADPGGEIERLTGEAIEWGGYVLDAQQVEDDLDFQAGPALKALVALTPVDQPVFTQPKINALVHFPGTNHAQLLPKDTVRFTGELVRFDPTGPTLFIGGARVLT